MIKNIFIDFDGTILPKGYNKIPESCIDALNRAHNNGAKIFLCTGRSIAQLNEFNIENIKFDGFIIANGQIVYDNDNNIIYDYPFRRDIQDKLIKIFNSNEIPMCFLTKDDFYINYVDEFVKEKQEAYKQSILKVRKYEGEKVYMASCFIENDQQKNKFMELGDDVHIVFWQNNGLNILNKGASKKDGIEHVFKYYNLKSEESLGIGDGSNDIPMFKACSYSCAVNNASDEVKKNASYITSNVENDGIYNALKHFKLI